MITPTRTVCTCIMEDGHTYRGARRFKLTPSVEKRFTEIGAWGSVKRVIVKEEPVEQYHPLMFHTSELPAIEVKPSYPATDCAKRYLLNADCFCEGCAPDLWPRYQSHIWSLLERDIDRYKKGSQS